MNYIGIKATNIKSTVKELNRLLSNYHIYYQNLRNYHWNISGEHFFDLHEKFEELYNDAKVNIDEIAERILTLRMKPTSTLKEYLEIADIEEKSTTDAREMVKNIIDNQSQLIQNMRDTIESASKIGDEGTIDMLSSFLSNIEKKSWMLDAWVNRS
jgi:starvation-inducible DNA-binding protein